MSEPNPAHFMVSQKFRNSAQLTTGWWVKWVGSPTHIKEIIYLFLSIQIFLNLFFFFNFVFISFIFEKKKIITYFCSCFLLFK